MRTLVVVTHPSPDGLARRALVRVLAGLERAGDDVEVIDLDAEAFDPRLTTDEKRRHLDPPETKPWVADHAYYLAVTADPDHPCGSCHDRNRSHA